MTDERETPEADELTLERCLRFSFEDPRWPAKLLVGGAFTLLGVLGVGLVWVSGYTARVIRRVRRGEQPPLPEWRDLKGLFYDGLAPFVVLATHLAIPPLLLVLLTVGFGVLLARWQQPPVSPTELQDAFVGLVAVGTLLVSLAGLGLILYLPAVLLRCVEHNGVRAAVELRSNVRFIRANLRDYKRVLAAFFAASFVAQFGLLVLCVGFFPAAFWSSAVLAYALGVLARDKQRRRGV